MDLLPIPLKAKKKEKPLQIFTSESVSNGHPDKVADQISDAILDAYLREDPLARVACEALVSKDLVVLSGEITSSAKVNHQEVVRDVIRKIGYCEKKQGFDYAHSTIIENFSKQSKDIACGINEGEGLDLLQGAGDQGMMFGYACKDTEELMPLPIMLSHSLMKNLVEKRALGAYPFLRPDAKSQVSVVFDEKGKAKSIDSVVLSTQHTKDISHSDLTRKMHVFIHQTLPSHYMTEKTKLYINPTGTFLHGGPACDTGLTGRKIIVDTYGGFCRHGGGAFSGKDPSKVDRSASYAARYVAKNLVEAGLLQRCELQIAYVIGVHKPISILLNSFNTNTISEKVIIKVIKKVFDLSPKGIIRMLQLDKQAYLPVAFGGHFGRSAEECSWEAVDKVEECIKTAYDLYTL